MEHTRLGLDAAGHTVSLTLHERLRQIAVLGKTGMGKSTLLRSLIAQDIARGDGVMLIDPHGTLAEECLPLVPPTRRNQVCVFDLADGDYPVAFDLFDRVASDERSLLVEGIVSAMHYIWGDSWGPQLERILRNSLIALLDTPGTTFLHLPLFLTDPEFHARIVKRTKNPIARGFFERQFDTWPREFVETSISPVLNKVEAFAVNDRIRNVLAQPQSKLHLEHALRQGRIVIAKLAKGQVGDQPSAIVGALLLSRALAAAMARERDPDDRKPFHIYIDEGQSFPPPLVKALLTDPRKYSVSVVLATQFLQGLDVLAQQAVLGSTGTLVCFQLGVDDARHLAPIFNREHQEFNAHRLYNLQVGEAWCRGVALYPDPNPPTYPDPHIARQQSRRHYARPRDVAEKEVARVFMRPKI